MSLFENLQAAGNGISELESVSVNRAEGARDFKGSKEEMGVCGIGYLPPEEEVSVGRDVPTCFYGGSQILLANWSLAGSGQTR